MAIKQTHTQNSDSTGKGLAASGKGTQYESELTSVGGAASALAPPPAPRDQTGAPPSNTAPSKYIPSQNLVQVLRCGVDSLYLSFKGSLSEETEAKLEHLKLLAQSLDIEDKAAAFYELGNHSFVVEGRGRGRFPFVLADNWLSLSVSRRSSTSLPLAMVQVSSELLTRSSLLGGILASQDVVFELGTITDSIGVSRVDLCVDFTTSLDLSTLAQEYWITRAIGFNQFWQRDRYSGCTFGSGGEISCRLYDKTLEIQKSKKEFFYPIWKNSGWDEVSNVWRLEFQIKRSVLKALGVTTEEHLQANLRALWLYCVNDWLRLALPSNDPNKSRWPTHPFWEVFQRVDWGQPEPMEPLHRISKSRTPSPDSLFVNGIGAITSYMAMHGLADFDEGLKEFGKAAHAYHLERARKTGKTLTTYALEHVVEKGRRFNKAKSPKRLAERAEAYRKTKEGE